MPLSLDELRDLVRDVVKAQQLDASVAGVTRTEGDGCYAEVLVTLNRGGEARRVAVGVERDRSAAEVRADIDRSLRRQLTDV